MSYRPNVTDKSQNELESAAFEGGIPVHVDQKVVVDVKGKGGAERKIGGVIVSWKDNPGKFMDNVGKP
jgi:hypothetical protein